MKAYSNSQEKKGNMLTDSPGRAMFFFALPMIMGNFFQQFYNIIDSVVVGRFVGEEALASVGASASITSVFIAVAIGGGVGSSVLVSQFLGAGRMGQMRTAVSTTLINFLGLSIVLGLAGYGLNDTILRLMHTPDNVFADAATYLRIYFMGLPFLFMYNVQASIFQSMGDSRTPLYLLIFSSLLNVVLDLWFVLEFHLAVAGVAWATLIAQGISALLSFGLLIARVRNMGKDETGALREEEPPRFRFYDGGMVLRMVKVALPSTIQQSIVNVGMLLVQSVINGFGSAVMAGYAAGSRLESLSIVPMLAAGNAMSTFSAQNMGAGRPDRVRRGYRAGYAIVGGFAVGICLVMQLWGRQFVLAFMDGGGQSDLALQTGLQYTKFISFFYVFIGLKAITDGLLRGAGDMVVFTAANLVNLTIRVTVAFWLAPVIGPQAVWYAVPMGWLANYLISFCRYAGGRWERIRLVEKEKGAAAGNK